MKRYSPVTDEMRLDAQGEYVSLKDAEELEKRNARLLDLLQQWFAGETRGAAIPKNWLMKLVAKELAVQAKSEGKE